MAIAGGGRTQDRVDWARMVRLKVRKRGRGRSPSTQRTTKVAKGEGTF